MEVAQVPEQPKGVSVVIMSFTSNIVEVQREQRAFPFISLVADVGGVLGLFIGFNFLMVWDWLVEAVKKVWLKNFHLFNFNCIHVQN